MTQFIKNTGFHVFVRARAVLVKLLPDFAELLVQNSARLGLPESLVVGLEMLLENFQLGLFIFRLRVSAFLGRELLLKRVVCFAEFFQLRVPLLTLIFELNFVNGR